MNDGARAQRNVSVIKWLTFLMFMMFAMTTDSVGVIIPEVIKEFHLSMTVGGAFHYAAMSGIALAGFFLGYLADRFGRKRTIILGLALFALNSYLFAVGQSFVFFLALLLISGAAIGIFKTGALALIGDISTSTTEHTATMNAVEGFFAVGAIIGPAIVAHFLAVGMSWKWLYVIAGSICVILVVTASSVRYPQTTAATESVALRRTVQMMERPLMFSVFRERYSFTWRSNAQFTYGCPRCLPVTTDRQAGWQRTRFRSSSFFALREDSLAHGCSRD